LAGLAGNKFLTKNLFQQLFKMKTFTPDLPSSSNNSLYFSSYDVFNLVTPGQSTSSCLQLFRIFINVIWREKAASTFKQTSV